MRERWKTLTPHQKKKWIRRLRKKNDLEQINWWYVQYARDKQIPPPGDWFCWLLRSGRGFGKTRTGAEWVV